MAANPSVYSLTAAGQEALSAKDVGDADFPLEVDFPSDYRRLLAMIEVGGHIEVLRGRLRSCRRSRTRTASASLRPRWSPARRYWTT